MSYCSESRLRAGLYPVVLLAAILCLLGQRAMAAEVVLQDIKITKEGAATQVEISLGRALGYVKHFPQTFGEIIQIQLLLDADKQRLIHKEMRQGKELQAVAGGKQPLTYVTYEEGVPGGPYLTLRFTHPMEFTVEAKSDTSLLITLTEKQQTQQASSDISTGSTPPGMSPPPGTTSTAPQSKQLNVGELMAKARQALTFGDNEGSARLLRKIIAIPDNPHAQEARELLGLSLERSKQIDRARFEYNKYLELYKKGDGPTRVKQRLQALDSMGIVKKRKKLRVVRREEDRQTYKFFGRISQDYGQNLALDNPELGPGETASSDEKFVKTVRSSSHVSLRGRYQDGNRIINSVMTGSYSWSQFGDRDPRKDTRPSDFYVNYSQDRDTLFATLGLHRARSAGVYDRFWGVTGGAEVSEGVTVSLLGGDVYTHDVTYEKNFFAVKAALGKRRAIVSGNVYMVNQTVDSMADREAMGGDMRYSEKEVTMFGSLDYDTFYGVPTLGNVRWGWQYNKKSRLNISYDYRNLIFTSQATRLYYTNATLNYAFDGIDEMRKVFSDERIKEIARAYTAKTHSITAGTSIQEDKDNQYTFDFSMYKSLDGDSVTITQAEVDRVPGGATTIGEGNTISPLLENRTYTLSAQWIASNALQENDLHVVGVRASQYQTRNAGSGQLETTSTDVSLFVNSRLAPINNWNPRPRLTMSYRKFAGVSTGNRLMVQPTVKLDYRWKKEWVFDVEFGITWLDYANDDFDKNEGAIRLGYNYTF
ncbi:MAG: tetratricopeptide repeat protein [Gammaproteobacteria bacterium]|nr:tetratricopeptide repeat protein [Gammaproteobacteria bacterium]MDH5800751.1 tetratricopeptide repeat protein [Gammaproteobacteria bacterium]